MRSLGFLRVVGVLVGVATSGAAQAGNGMWTPTGPDGGPVTALAIDPASPQVVYAGTAGDLFKSTDGGATWRSSAEGLPLSTPVLALAVDPHTAGKLYASVRAHGVFASTDAGAHWAASNTGMETATLHSLAVDPLAGTLYAGAAQGNTQPLYTSADGATWAPAGTGLPAALDVSIAIQAVPQGTTIFAGVPGTGVWRSSNSGATFTLLAGSPFDVTKVMVDPQNPLTLHAITTSNGYAQSVSSGLSWNTLNNHIPVGSRSAADLAIDVAGALYLASGPAGSPASLYKSTDNAANWSLVSAAPPIQYGGLYADPSNAGTLYIATVTLIKTTNGGTSFAAATSGLGVRDMEAVAMDSGGALYATDGSVFKSTNAGRAWAGATTGLGSAQVHHALAIAPSAPDTVRAGTVVNSGGTLFWSAAHTVSGGSWRGDTGLASDSGPVNVIVVDPMAPSVAWLGTDVGGLYKTTNGMNWTHVDALTATRVRAIVLRSNMIYVGTGDGVFVSTTAGVSWTAVSSGLTDRSVASLIADPDDAETFYAGTDGRLAGGPNGLVFRTRDGATSWHLVTTGLPSGPGSEVSALATRNGVLYLGTWGNGVFRSTDGSTWSELNTGLRARQIEALAIAPGSPPVVYAATSTGGVQTFTEGPLVDGGVGDDASQDGGREDARVAPDSGVAGDGSGGCGCRTTTGGSPGAWGLLALGLLMARRSRASSKRS